MSKVKPQISTDQLIKRLHLMADTGGMLTRDRIEAVRQAADRLEKLEEHITDCNECFYCDKEDRWCLKFDLVNMHDGFYCSDAKRKEGDEP